MRETVLAMIVFETELLLKSNKNFKQSNLLPSWTEEPGGLPSMGSHRVGHDWSNLAAAYSILMKNDFKIYINM